MSIIIYACLTLIFLVLLGYCYIQDEDIVNLQKQIDFLKSQMRGKK